MSVVCRWVGLVGEGGSAWGLRCQHGNRRQRVATVHKSLCVPALCWLRLLPPLSLTLTPPPLSLTTPPLHPLCSPLNTYQHKQTETPEQLKARNAARAPGQKMVNVVQREAVAVLSRGTLIDPEMVAAHPDAAYVLAGGWVCV